MRPTGMTRAGGDTIIIPDGANSRINWIVPSKGFVAMSPMPPLPSSGERRYRGDLRPVGVLRSGDVVMSTAGLVQQAVADSVTRPTSLVAVWSPRTESATIVASIPDLELKLVETRYRGRVYMQSTTLRLSRSAMAIAWDTVIATGSGEGYRIDLRDAKGQLRSALHVAVRRRPVTKEMRDSVIAEGLRRLDAPRSEGTVDKAESRRLEHIYPFADSLPPYGHWFLSPDRTLWIVDPSTPADTTGGATAFRQDGAVIGRLMLVGKANAGGLRQRPGRVPGGR
jgi:hypothetical protein